MRQSQVCERNGVFDDRYVWWNTFTKAVLLPYLVVVALGVPLLLSLRRTHPRWKIFRSPVPLGFLTDGYHRRFFWWEGFYLARR